MMGLGAKDGEFFSWMNLRIWGFCFRKQRRGSVWGKKAERV